MDRGKSRTESLGVGAVGTEIKVPCVENPELSKVLSFNHGVGQDKASRAAQEVCLSIFCIPRSLNFFPLRGSSAGRAPES